MDEHLFFYFLAGVPLLGVAAQWLARRLRLPSILLLLAFGVLLGRIVDLDNLLARLVGAEGLSGQADVSPRLLFPVVSLAVAVILFEGGLSLRLSELKTAGRGVFRLVLVGAGLSWLLTAYAAKWLLGWDMRMAALLGAILVVTGPTVVMPMLRQIRPVRRVASIVKWEGIVIDPLGAVLAVLVFEGVLAQEQAASLGGMLGVLLRTAAIGSVGGLVTAAVLILAVKRYWLPDYLHGVAFLAAALGVFTLSDSLQPESGLVTVTVLGIVLANQKFISIRHVIEFKEHLRVFLISCLFIVLGSRLDPRDLWDLGWQGGLFLLALILLVRPASVYLSLLGTRLSYGERTLLAFLAPRGIVAAAVTSVFALKVATLDQTDGRELLSQQAEQFVPVTFLVIVGTVAIYGLTSSPLARWLRVSDTNAQGVLFAGAEPWIRDLAAVLSDHSFPVLLVDTNYSNIAAARMAGLPADCCSILSEHAREELDLSGIGRLLAVTANDEVNALAVGEFAPTLGRAHVYQLSPANPTAGRRISVGHHLRGRALFGAEVHHDALIRRMKAGARIKKTNLTEEFTFTDFQDLYGESAVMLFLVENGNKLRVCAEDEPLTPQPGHTVIALVDPSDAPSPANANQSPG